VELDAFFAAELNALRLNLRAAGRLRDFELKQAWAKLDAVSGYGLDALDVDLATVNTRRTLTYDLLRTEGESSDEADEDKPQVVLLDESELAGVQDTARSSRWRDEDEDDEVEIRL
jgi:hypothetical protein